VLCICIVLYCIVSFYLYLYFICDGLYLYCVCFVFVFVFVCICTVLYCVVLCCRCCICVVFVLFVLYIALFSRLYFAEFVHGASPRDLEQRLVSYLRDNWNHVDITLQDEKIDKVF
jgi:hypothetical protein